VQGAVLRTLQARQAGELPQGPHTFALIGDALDPELRCSPPQKSPTPGTACREGAALEAPTAARPCLCFARSPHAKQTSNGREGPNSGQKMDDLANATDYPKADALEQLGYQSENGVWRNEYLTAAKELREGVKAVRLSVQGPDVAAR
jgi:hypothetical protein